MRFRFCGDLDCPDWVLAEISILSKITSVKMKLLCVQVIKDLLGDGIDFDKVYKLTADAKFETGDVKASIAALTFILTSAAKYSVDGDTLSNELQQLGLPKEHAGSLTKSYSDSLEKLQTRLREQSLRLSSLESVKWRVDYILSSSELKDINEPNVQVRLEMKNPDTQTTEPVAFTVSADKFRVLLNASNSGLIPAPPYVEYEIHPFTPGSITNGVTLPIQRQISKNDHDELKQADSMMDTLAS